MINTPRFQMASLERKVLTCERCGVKHQNKSAIGTGKIESPAIFFIGMNPWTNEGKFKNGRGITLLFKKLKEWEFDDFFFDNVVKCEMPNKKTPKKVHADHCKKFILEQLQILKNPKILTFGQFAAEQLDLRYIPWENSENTITVPHFSSIFYPRGMSSHDYYSKLKKIIDSLPK